MNVLSLFDGMGCGAIALKELGFDFNYYSSEVDKFATAQSKLNFPDSIQLGDVRNIDPANLPKIDLIIGGSPCQSFSFAGKRKGMATKQDEEIYTLERYLELKEQGFEFEGQSYLFWEYMRILVEVRKVNPSVLFLLENVVMVKKWERVLSQAIGIFGVHINSNLVSAQNRSRIYWTNIKTKNVGLFGELYSDIPQPQDRGILLKDILQPENQVDEKYYLSEKLIKGFENKQTKGFKNRFKPHENLEVKGNAICSSTAKIVVTDNFIQVDRKGNIKKDKNKASSLTIAGHGAGNHSDMDVLIVPENTSKGYAEIKPGECVDLDFINSKTRRGRKMDKKSNALLSMKTMFAKYTEDYKLRRLTPTECARLQTVPEWYEWQCSDTQQYRQLGNGWTIEVIKHIFSFIY